MRRIPLSRRSHVTGFRPLDGEAVEHESALERDFVLLVSFLDAGAILLPPGCGPCAGGAGGPLASGEVSISTAATNGQGRMGAKDAHCYLGSPLTVAASAVAGRIADPRPGALRSPRR